MKKSFCVHVFERHDYENVLAESAEKAGAVVVAENYPNGSDDISYVEVMRQCDECGYDNDAQEKTCDECGKPL